MSRTRSIVGLALAGGGPQGAVYEIGALRAIDEALLGAELAELEIYVGVSAGAFVAACLANGLTPAQLSRAIVKPEPGEHPFSPKVFFAPAFGEYVRSGLKVPRLMIEALWEYATRPEDLTLLESLTRLARALPVGVFDNEPIREYMAKIFSLKGRTDDFRRLGCRLIVVAADLCSARAVKFGEPGLDHVPISRAVQASTALPGIYPPVEIDDRRYVDGVLLKTVHASVALDAGADFLICINPIVPLDTRTPGGHESGLATVLTELGLPSVLSQTFRTLIHSRLTVGFATYQHRYRNADTVLLEPGRDDREMFFTNIFSFTQRKAVCEHAYQTTRRQLLHRRSELQPKLSRHGLGLDWEVLADPSRTLWGPIPPPHGSASPVGERLAGALADLERFVQRQSV